MNLTNLKKQRSTLRKSFTKAVKRMEEGLENPERDVAEISSLMKVLDQRFEGIEQLNFQINGLLTTEDVPERELEAEQDKIDEYCFTYFKMKVAHEEVAQFQAEERKSACSSNASSSKKKYKLPVLELKKFGGEIGEWLPFWGQFEKIHEDNDMDDVDKLNYLTQAMKEKSPARELVESYPATRNMYPVVAKALEERFGRKDLLTEYYIRGLLGIVIQNAIAKEKLSLPTLHDKVQSHLRNLETLGVTNDKCAPILLPLVSSCLPKEILLSWERKGARDGSEGSEAVLHSLLKFLKTEVEGGQKIAMAVSGFGLPRSASVDLDKGKKPPNDAENIPTAAGLLSTSEGTKSCIFCSSFHNPQDCNVALSMSLKERRKAVVDRKACFCCLLYGHPAKFCRNRPKCTVCQKSHFALVCDSTEKNPTNASSTELTTSRLGVSDSTSDTLASMAVSCSVLLETMRIRLYCGKETRVVRAIIDSGSQRTYVLKDTAKEMGYQAQRSERINHCLFGGVNTGVIDHEVFRLFATSLDGSYSCNFEAVEQIRICNYVQPVPRGPWMKELEENDIELSDFCEGPIEVLIGADIAGKLLTGRHKLLTCGLSAIETRLGWALMGKIPSNPMSNVAMTVISMLTKDVKITDLWALDTLGIGDPTERRSVAEMETATLSHFLRTVAVLEDGRFEVDLPWVENHPPLQSNYQLALKRTHNTVRKLKRDGLYNAYQNVLNEWVQDGIIEEVLGEESESSHYLPHRHVIKPGSTTPVRPVFDASARESRNPSLNQCLEKGPNTIVKIPSIMARFREKKVGVVGDIRRAFLQISIRSKDRDYLRFIWITENGCLKTFRHCRVVFGLSPSPFQLGACIDFHLQKVLEDCKEGKRDTPIDLVEQLRDSFYVDNCLTSMGDTKGAHDFVELATSLMLERKFELRGWELNSMEPCPPTNVLGMSWDRHDDTLFVDVKGILAMDFEQITKRVILSAAHKIYDPMGLVSCVTLVPKCLLQKTWEVGLGWDEGVGMDITTEFLSWINEVHYLSEAKIPRWLPGTNIRDDGWSLHVFSDACQRSYGCVIFLRVEYEGQVRVQLVQAKSRVSPSTRPARGLTIPRLELLAASIAARLYKNVIEDYRWEGIKTNFHTDSATALAWILRQEPWEVFVYNRVKEIRELTLGCKWSHIPGTENPADLSSRGCSPKSFVNSRWWEGPGWLKKDEKLWPQPAVDYNEEEINQERKRVIVSSLLSTGTNDWYYKRFSHYKMIIRMVGWICRLKNNAKKNKCDPENCVRGEMVHLNGTNQFVEDLTAKEFSLAEYKVLSMVQNETFNGVLDPKLSSLLPFVDEHGLIRIMTKVSYRVDMNGFRHPIVLATEHPVVQRLIMDVHVENCHAGVQMLLSILRQQFWMLGGRRALRNVLSQCVRCKRFSSRKMESTPTPLPEARVRDAKIFEITGVDLAGPLYLKIGDASRMKAYVCLFTCAVYRAVHLELISSQSTDSFIQGLRRFMSRRGRPSIIFSDNGSNFVGFNNATLELDWKEITRYTSIRKIEWRFNPPSSPWWGGWWERLIGVLKALLRRVLGQASLNYEETQTVLCECEAVINSRPLTYLSDDASDLTALTPSMFLHDVEEIGTLDLDKIESTDLCKRVRYRQKLCQALRERFRSEYLGQLKLSATKKKARKVVLGEIVLVGDDKSARLNWPLARVVGLTVGTDGNVRVVKVKTASGELTRPIQRLYPLEVNLELNSEDRVTTQFRDITRSITPRAEEFMDSGEHQVEDDNGAAGEEPPFTGPVQQVVTRSGRIPVRPQKLDL